MDVQDAFPQPAWRQASANGTDRKAGEDEGEESEQDTTSDGEFIRLTQQLAENPTEENERKLRDSEAKLRRKARRVARRKKELKAMLWAYKQKEREFIAQMDTHMEEVERHEQDLGKRIEALTAENQDLRESTERRARENAASQEKLVEISKLCSESETRVQFLMERILALLTASSADPALIENVAESRRREREVLRQIEEVRQQFDEVRQQNGELTSRLTDEMSLSRRLSEQLAEVEERFFHHRPDRLPQGDATAQLRAAGLLNSQLRLPDAPPDLPQAEEPLLPPLPGDRHRDSSEPGRRTPLVAVPETDVPTGLDFDLDQDRSMGLSQGLPLDTEGMEPIAEDPHPGAGLELEDVGVRVPREDQLLSRASNGARRLPSPGHTASTVELMESKLRKALDRAAFECAVVRVESGVYDFGPNVRAVVRLTSDNEVVASRDGQGRFEPIDEFIRNVAQRSQVWEERAAEDSTGAPRTGPPSSAPPVVGAEPSNFPPEREASRTSSPQAMAGAPSGVLPGSARSPRSHWQPQAAGVQANASPPHGNPGHTATPPPQRSNSSSSSRGAQQQPQQQQLGASLRSRQPQEPVASSSNVQARAGTRSAPAVPPLQLHLASLMPLHSRSTASSTPERPRTGLPPSQVQPATALGAPLVSPRPQALQHKPPARQLASSPPRMVRTAGPSAAAPPRVAVTQSPRRQVTPT